MKTRFFALAAGLLACLQLASPAASTAAEIAGRGTLSGTVTAPQSFQAARVYAQHSEMNVVFMVYTVHGRFQAVNLFPGSYEVWVEKEGFASGRQNVEITAGQNASVNVALHVADTGPAQAFVGGRNAGNPSFPEVPYDELFPDEPGRAHLEQSCFVCHGENFISRNPKPAAGWDAAIQLMTGQAPGAERWDTPILSPDAFTPEEWDTLRAYLGKHFNEDAPPRSLLDTRRTPVPLDEQALAKAQWIEYRLPLGGFDKERRVTQEVHFDNTGGVWFTERGGNSDFSGRGPGGVGRLDPLTGTVEDYPHLDPFGDAHGLTVDTDGYVWWAGRPDYLVRLHPETGEMIRFNGEQGTGHTPVTDSKGNIWFSVLAGNKLGVWEKASAEVMILDVPNGQARPYGIYVDPQDKVWFAEFHSCGVTRYDPETKEFSRFDAPSKPCRIRRLGGDWEGNVWYGNNSAGKIGRVNPTTGEIKEWEMPAQPGQPYDVWPDAQGNVWISDDGPEPAVMIKFDPRTERFTYFPSVQQADMPKVQIARDGGIWYTPRSGAGAVGVFYEDVSTMEAVPHDIETASYRLKQ